ncbi:MAG: preprotein translocase subunit SecG [Alphaproteobacteria bacterium]|nr:preprotein translocase subunit SecG [Alphaproteobacteria bacterium]
MQTALLIVHIVLAILMIGLVLLQKSEGGALGMGGGPGGFMSTRGTANLLTRATGILAGLFFASTLGLAILFKGGQAPKSLLDNLKAEPTTEAPLVPGQVHNAPAPQPQETPAVDTKAADKKETPALTTSKK